MNAARNALGEDNLLLVRQTLDSVARGDGEHHERLQADTPAFHDALVGFLSSSGVHPALASLIGTLSHGASPRSDITDFVLPFFDSLRHDRDLLALGHGWIVWIWDDLLSDLRKSMPPDSLAQAQTIIDLHDSASRGDGPAPEKWRVARRQMFQQPSSLLGDVAGSVAWDIDATPGALADVLSPLWAIALDEATRGAGVTQALLEEVQTYITTVGARLKKSIQEQDGDLSDFSTRLAQLIESERSIMGDEHSRKLAAYDEWQKRYAEGYGLWLVRLRSGLIALAKA